MNIKPYDTIRYEDMPDPQLRYDMITGRFVLTADYVTPEVTVPAGEYTDGASRPDLVEVVVKQFDRHLGACIVHDYMYRQAMVLPGWEHDPKLGADTLFRENLYRASKLYGFDVTLIGPMFEAVKLFGRGNYGRS